MRGGPGIEKEKGAVLVWREKEISLDPEGFTLFWSVVSEKSEKIILTQSI